VELSVLRTDVYLRTSNCLCTDSVERPDIPPSATLDLTEALINGIERVDLNSALGAGLTLLHPN